MSIPAMRRNARQLSSDQTIEILEQGTFGVLSTVDMEGQPYGVPLNYVFHQGVIYFHCAKDGYKLMNLSQNSRVSFCVVVQSTLLPEQFSTDYVSAIVFGTARQIKGQEKVDALRLLIRHLAPNQIDQGEDTISTQAEHTAVVKIVIDHLSGKSRKQEK
ncbi:MAG: MFS transporter [Chloroflexi bacterium HGW-Chloroflexi-8]|nr:MAG: MFS transporter [Chloroflexi bacterium HGW-Chloroflexi-8]